MRLSKILDIAGGYAGKFLKTFYQQHLSTREAFIHKNRSTQGKISRKEAKESRYWLRLLDVNQVLENERQDLVNEVIELKNILSTILQKSN